MNARRRTAIFVALVGSIFLAGFFIDRYVKNDEALPQVIDYVKTNPRIREHYGHISDIQIKKLSEVSGSLEHPTYKLYALYVTGEKNAGVVEVKAVLNAETLDVESMQLGR